MKTPLDAMLDPQNHRKCRRCGHWFEPHEGAMEAPEFTGPLGAIRALESSFDGSNHKFQCERCSTIRRRTQLGLVLSFFLLFGAVLLLEYFGVIQ